MATATGSRKRKIGSDTEDKLVHHPEWIQKLLEYYQFVKRDIQNVKDGNKQRERYQYTLFCMLCKEKPKKAKNGKGNESRTASQITGNGVHTFKRHLERCHAGEYDEEKCIAGPRRGPYPKSASEDNNNHESIIPSVVGVTGGRSSSSSQLKKYDAKAVKQLEFNKLCLDWIARDGHPLNSSERVGFKKIIDFLDPRLSCPSRTTIARLLDSQHQKIQQHLNKVLREMKTGSAHLLLDIWSSRQKMADIGVQVRFIRDWKIQQLVLGFKHFPGTHDAKSIQLKLETLLSDEYALSIRDFATVTADNASAILLAFKDLGVCHPQTRTVFEPSTQQVITHALITETPGSAENPQDLEDELLDIPDDDEQNIQQNYVDSAELESIIDSVIRNWSSGDRELVRRNSCLAHLLQLAIKDALKQNEVACMVKKVNGIITWFHKSNRWYTTLKEQTKLGLVKPVETRWNSTFYSLQRLCESITVKDEAGDKLVTMAAQVNTVLQEAKKTKQTRPPTTFCDTDIRFIGTLVKLLEPFAELTNDWQGDGVVSSQVLLGIVDTISVLDEIKTEEEDSDLEDDGNDTEHFDASNALTVFKCELRKSVIERFSTNKDPVKTKKTAGNNGRNIVTVDVFNDKYLILATLLDPRLKTTPFEDGFAASLNLKNGYPSKTKVVELLKESFKQEEMKLRNDVVILNDSQTASPTGIPLASQGSTNSQGQVETLLAASTSRSTVMKKPKRDMFARIQKFQENKKATTEKVIDEVEQYITASTIHRSKNPLNFWKLNEERFPVLANLAVKYLSMPVTSAAVERLFSIAGALLRSRRASMMIETAEKLLMHREYLERGIGDA